MQFIKNYRTIRSIIEVLKRCSSKDGISSWEQYVTYISPSIFFISGRNLLQNPLGSTTTEKDLRTFVKFSNWNHQPSGWLQFWINNNNYKNLVSNSNVQTLVCTGLKGNATAAIITHKQISSHFSVEVVSFVIYNSTWHMSLAIKRFGRSCVPFLKRANKYSRFCPVYNSNV